MENIENVNILPLVDVTINSINQMRFDLYMKQDEQKLSFLIENSYLDCDTNRVQEFIDNEIQ